MTYSNAWAGTVLDAMCGVPSAVFRSRMDVPDEPGALAELAPDHCADVDAAWRVQQSTVKGLRAARP